MLAFLYHCEQRKFRILFDAGDRDYLLRKIRWAVSDIDHEYFTLGADLDMPQHVEDGWHVCDFVNIFAVPGEVSGFRADDSGAEIYGSPDAWGKIMEKVRSAEKNGDFFSVEIALGSLKRVEVVAALVLDAAGRVLATQCAPHRHGGGWEFPGGKVEPGESPQAALKREIAEELGVSIAVGDLLKTVEWDYPAFHLTMHCYICRQLAGELQLREHVAYRWLSADTLRTVEWLPADVEVLDALEQHLRG